MESAEEFRRAGYQLIDYVADYMENIRERPVLSSVQPGFMRQLIPESAPEKGESWEAIFQDIDRVIMPGVTHHSSPQFHAYFHMSSSFPGILAGVLTEGLGLNGLTWVASPVVTELEVVMLDWLGKLLDLPPVFLACSEGKGGGIIQGTASESVLLTLLAARSKKLLELKAVNEDLDETLTASRFVAYTSDQSHTASLKAARIGGVQNRVLPTDDDLHLRASTLQAAIEEDRANGKIPFFVTATLGTTPSCSFDDLNELGPVCNKEGVWMHVDAAYAGSALICPEFRHYATGLEMADSFNFNPHKWILINFDCSALWFKDSKNIVDALYVDNYYLNNNEQRPSSAPDYRHWQVALGRRFRALKMWFVMRSYGAEGLRAHVRNQVQLANHFHQLMAADTRFEFPVPPSMGLVCFRLKGENSLTEELLKRITEAGKTFMTPAKLRGQYTIRMVIGSRYTQQSDVQITWDEIRQQTNTLLQ